MGTVKTKIEKFRNDLFTMKLMLQDLGPNTLGGWLLQSALTCMKGNPPTVKMVKCLYAIITSGSIYGQLLPGAEFRYEFCRYFQQNACTLLALESSIYNGTLCRLLHLSYLDLLTTLTYELGPKCVPKSQNIVKLKAKS